MNKLSGKIKDSLSIKIFLGVTGVLIIVSLLIFGCLWILMPKVFDREQSAQFTTNLHELSDQLEQIEMEELEVYITSFAIENRSNVIVSDSNNATVCLVNIAQETDESSERNNNTVVGVVTFQNEGHTYTLSADIVVSATDQLTGVFIQVFPYIVIVIFVLSALAALLYSRILAKPIVNISHISRKMTTLDMTWRCETNRSDEIGLLAVNLNQMASTLDHALTELRASNEKLQADIEWERQQEKQRKDFFAAISHELKTPVAVLKGELEGMICNVGKFKDRDTYLQEAYETAESIEKFVKDIMSLTKMNMEDMKLEKQQLSLNELVTGCVKTHEELAAAKQIIVRQDLEDDIICYADYMSLQKAISNIIGNAIYHSPEKASISITTRNRLLSIENSGINIPVEEIKRVFEPFYRIDKSRSRHTGGSGLGLYIVKTILDRNGFEYILENTETGVKFTIVFSD